MDNFSRGGNRGGRGGGRGGFGGGKRFGGGGFKGGFNKGGPRRDPNSITMHAATCESCKKACEVPFRPTGEKPVYCRDCFAGRAAMGGDRSRRPDRRYDRGERRDFRDDRDSRSFAPKAFAPEGNSNGDIKEIKKQIEAMNSKLDELISSVNNLSESLGE